MSNPLDRHEKASFENSKMQAGETRTIFRDKGGPVIITRTTRPYQFDLADAYNAARSQTAVDSGMVWVAMPNGEVKLDFSFDELRSSTARIQRTAERERANWKHAHGYGHDEAA